MITFSTVSTYFITNICTFRIVIKQKTEELQEVETYGTELVSNAESKILKLQSQIQAKESMIGDLQHGGTGMTYIIVLNLHHFIFCL